MANAKSLQDAIESLKDMQGGLGQLSEMMESTQQVSDGLLSSFKDFATAGSSSSLWNAVSRFSSGIFPGFWSIQNKIRSVAVYMQYVEKKQKEQIKKEAEIAKTINRQTETRINAAKTLDTLNKKTAQNEWEMQQLMEDDYFKSLVARMDVEEALLKYKEQFNDQMWENVQSELTLAHHVTDRIKYEEKYQELYKQAGFENRKNLTDSLYFFEQEEKIRESIAKLEQEEKSHSNFMKREADGVFVSMTEEEKLQAKINKGAVAGQIAAQKAKLSSTQKTRQFLAEQTGTSTDGTYAKHEDGAREEKSLGELIGDSFKKKFNNINKWVIRMGMIAAIIKRQGMMKALGSILKPIGLFLKNGLMIMGYALLIIMAFGLLVFFLIKSGILDGVLSVIDMVITFISVFTDVFMMVWDGISDFFVGIFTFLSGAFGGDGKKMLDGFALMLGGIIQFALGVFLGTIALLGATATGLIWGVVDWVIGWAKNKYDDFEDNFWGTLLELIIDIGIIIATWRLADLAYKAAGGGWTGAAAIAGITLVGGAMANFAGGGRVGQGGNILVGEAGPEIVSLPSNSFVTPAQQSKGMMGNNISVNVNGRVGASDSELNEIARKIGQKINREMNKYGSSGYRA